MLLDCVLVVFPEFICKVMKETAILPVKHVGPSSEVEDTEQLSGLREHGISCRPEATIGLGEDTSSIG